MKKSNRFVNTQKKQSGDSNPSEQQNSNRGQQLPFQSQQQPQHTRRSFLPVQSRQPLEACNTDDISNVNDGQKGQSHNRVMVARTRTPIVPDFPQSLSFLENKGWHYNDDGSRSTSPNAVSSCVSSLSEDESHYCFSNLASVVQDDTPVRMMNNSPYHHQHCHHHTHSEESRIGDDDLGRYGAPSLRLNSEYESPLPKLLLMRGDAVPHQLIFSNARMLRIVSNECTVERRHTMNSIRSGEGGFWNYNAEALDDEEEEEVTQRYPKRHRQGSEVRCLEPNQSSPRHHRVIPISSTPIIKRISSQSRMRRHYRGNSFKSKSSTIQTYAPATNYAHQNKNETSRHNSSSHLPNLDSSARLDTFSKSNSTVSLTNRSMALSRCGSYRQNSHYSIVPGISIDGGSNSITGASYDSIHQSSIVVNGRVVNGIKHRRRHNTVSVEKSGVIGGNDHNHPQLVGHNGTAICKAPIMGKVTELKSTPSLDSTSVKAPSSLESSKFNSNRSQTITGKRKQRRRAVKDDLKYLIGKIVPSPLKEMATVLTRNRSYDFERSSGCLT